MKSQQLAEFIRMYEAATPEQQERVLFALETKSKEAMNPKVSQSEFNDFCELSKMRDHATKFSNDYKDIELIRLFATETLSWCKTALDEWHAYIDTRSEFRYNQLMIFISIARAHYSDMLDAELCLT